MGSIRLFLQWMLCGLLIVTFSPNAAYGQSVASGAGLYGSGAGGFPACSGCHFGNAAPNTTQTTGAGSNHIGAANNFSYLKTALSPGGLMYAYQGGTPALPSDTQIMSLALYIGQYSAPSLSNTTLTTLANSSATINVYPLVSGGAASDSGFTKTNGANGTVGVAQVGATNTMNYNATYTPTAGYIGSDSFTLSVANPSGSDTRNVSVTVVGITSSGSASGTVGQSFNYAITTNGSVTGNYSAAGLPSGLSVNASSGVISGTPDIGSIGITNTTVSVQTSAGTASQTVTITIGGLTSPSTASVTQNTAFSYTATASPTATSFSTPPVLPEGLSVSGLTISGSPTTSGVYDIALQVNTAGGIRSGNLRLTVVSAGAPVITTLPSLAPAPALSLIGSVGTSISPITIKASNPPIDANSYSAINLPPGLTVNSANGLLSGTPTVSGDYAVTLRATNSAGSGIGTLNVILRVNAIGGPTLSSAATASGTVGINATVYQITTNGVNGPITAYSLLSGVLPAGLSLNTTTGAIAGTPTESGIFNLSVGATNSAGFTGSKAVALTIIPTAVPVITAPVNGLSTSLAFGAPITPITIAGTNPPLLSFANPSNNLPAGLTLDVATGIISGTPTAPTQGSAVTLTVTNAAGTSAAITITLAVGVPAPANCSLSTEMNTATTLDLQACMFPKLTPTGMKVAVPSANGTVSISGTRVTYTPKTNYFGSDAFSVVALFGPGIQSTTGTVSVVVTGRPNPEKDVAVGALLTSQTEAALRFSRAQISNYGRHLESLRGNTARQSTQPTTNLGYSNFVPQDSVNLVSQASASFRPEPSPTLLPTGNAPASLPLSSAVAIAANDLGLASSPLYNLTMGVVQNRAIDLGALRRSLANDTSLMNQSAETTLWAEGVASFGVRDASGNVSGAEFSSSGITIGVDRIVNPKLTIGMGVGYAKDTTRIGSDGSQNLAKGYSVAIYANYMATPNAFLEGLIGFGAFDFDAQRFVEPANEFAISQRKGTQMFGSIGAGWEHRSKGKLISPYGRIDFSSDRLNEATETGVGNYALTYFEQAPSSLQGALGLRGESVHAMRSGWVIPRARIEWRQDFKGESGATLRYADQVDGTRYNIAQDGSIRHALVLGLGSEFVFRDGWSVALDYQLNRVSALESSYAMRLKLIKGLGVKGLPNLMRGLDQDFDDEDELQLDASTTWDDNITRAKLDADRQADNIFALTVSKTYMHSLSSNSRLLATLSAGGERSQNFNGLSKTTIGVEATYQYRASAAFSSPTWSLFGRANAEDFQSRLRDGTRYALGASVLVPVTDRITMLGAISQVGRNANSAVFKAQESSARFNIDFDLRNSSTVYLTGEYRKGDIVSTGRPSLENVSIATMLAQDDAYADGTFVSYRLDAATWLTTVGYNLGLGARDSIDIAWRRVQSTPTLRPDWATSPPSYIANQLTASYLMRF